MVDGSNIGLYGFGGYTRLLPTSLTEGGDGSDLGARLELMYLNGGQSVGLGGAFSTTKGKLFPSTFADGTYTENSDDTFFLSWGKIEREIPDGPFYVAWRSTEEPRLGIGSLTADPPSRRLAGETIDLSGSDLSLFTIQRINKYGLEWRPAARFSLLFEAGYGTVSRMPTSGDISMAPVSSLGIVFGGWISGGLGDNTSEIASETALSSAGVAFGLYSLYGLDIPETLARREFLLKPMAQTNDLLNQVMGEAAAVDNPSMEDVPLIQAVSLLSGAGPKKLSLAAKSPAPWGHIVLGAEAIEGVSYLVAGADGKPGDHVFAASGLGALNRTVAMGMLLANARPESVWAEQKIAGAILMGGTYLLGKGSKTWGAGMAQAGIEASLSADRNPDPAAEEFVTAKTYRAGIWSYLKHHGKMAARGYFGVESDLKSLDGHLATGFSIATPLFGAANAGTRAENIWTEDPTPLPDALAPTTVRSEVVFKSFSDPSAPASVEGSIGPHLAMQFAGANAHVGIGLQARAEMAIRLTDSSALRFGAAAQATLMNDGDEFEFTPTAAFTWRY